LFALCLLFPAEEVEEHTKMTKSPGTAPTIATTTTTASPTWTPIKIGWNSTISADDPIHDPHITNNPVDDNKTSQHPFIAKLSSPLFLQPARLTTAPLPSRQAEASVFFSPKISTPIGQ